jgi:hypothetical protein
LVTRRRYGPLDPHRVVGFSWGGSGSLPGMADDFEKMIAEAAQSGIEEVLAEEVARDAHSQGLRSLEGVELNLTVEGGTYNEARVRRLAEKILRRMA